jgi:hypothetical protein
MRLMQKDMPVTFQITKYHPNNNKHTVKETE